MRYVCKQNQIEITDTEDFDPYKIFECGQCFRWNADENGVYTGVFRRKAAKVWREGSSVFIGFDENTAPSELIDYFDIERDYEAVRKSVGTDDYMRRAAEFGKGIRILRQEPWEMLCSFIISQCNNIPRIKKIIETMCTNFGEPIIFEGRKFYTFPSAERIAELNPCDLDPLRCGYRASYIVEAARKVAGGELDLNALKLCGFDGALKALKSLSGIGDKVANCVILYGLNLLDAFPIDVWIKKVLADHYDKEFNSSVFGEYAGIAQQYMFFYARSGEK